VVAMQSKLKLLLEDIQLYLNTEVVNLNKIKLKKKKDAPYEYFEEIAGNDERLITRKRYLPSTPFVNIIVDVI
jgi:hypothetical protein